MSLSSPRIPAVHAKGSQPSALAELEPLLKARAPTSHSDESSPGSRTCCQAVSSTSILAGERRFTEDQIFDAVCATMSGVCPPTLSEETLREIQTGPVDLDPEALLEALPVKFRKENSSLFGFSAKPDVLLVAAAHTYLEARDRLVSLEDQYFCQLKQISRYDAGLLNWTNRRLRVLAASEGIDESTSYTSVRHPELRGLMRDRERAWIKAGQIAWAWSVMKKRWCHVQMSHGLLWWPNALYCPDPRKRFKFQRKRPSYMAALSTCPGTPELSVLWDGLPAWTRTFGLPATEPPSGNFSKKQ